LIRAISGSVGTVSPDTGVEGPRSPQLTDPGHHAVETPEDRHRTLRARGLPSGGRLQRGKDLVEPVAQVIEDVIAIEAGAMADVQRRRRAADENRAWDERL
jgi:hypothetical protein